MTAHGTPYAGPAPAATARDAVAAPRPIAVRPALGPSLLAGDVAALVLGGVIGRAPWGVGALCVVVVLIAYQAGRLYRPRLSLSLLDDLPSLLGRALTAAGAVLLGWAVLRPSAPIRPLVYGIGAGVLLLLLVRGAAYAAIREARRRGVVAHRTVVVGDDTLGRRLAEEMGHHPEYGLRPVGYLGSGVGDAPTGVPLLGGTDDLARVVRRYDVSVVVLAFTSRPDRDLVSCVRTCDRLRCDIYWVPRLFELSPVHPQMDLLWGYPLVRRRREVFGPLGRTLKRSLDVLVAALALVVALPVLLGCALAVRLDGLPVLFRQRRLSAGLRPFVMVKFRTLPGPHDPPGRLGRFLRASSLDELPQLVNVLRGDMSLVGPRPECPSAAAEFGDRHPGYRDRHRVRAGLTGWSQIHGLRGPGSIEDRARFDNQYIENWGLWEDVKIILRTAAALVRHPGSSA
ncbi:sugar transferase [Micromonospora globispora]|uniref:Sugar transferase n=1 Tax=Micromonospora globispora TaxID=1450148 RepID=A0A317KES8_9ACTN|nr:exopolysaccharide biosynthesis polyprenyl glycosylphosphotransferase [Micromonospora globispora]PWU50059.1 sugar transferase [Micromonospora globispora]